MSFIFSGRRFWLHSPIRFLLTSPAYLVDFIGSYNIHHILQYSNVRLDLTPQDQAVYTGSTQPVFFGSLEEVSCGSTKAGLLNEAPKSAR